MIEYQEITMPEELYFYMRNIKYGYLTKDNKVIKKNKLYCDNYWYKNFMLQDTNDIIKTNTGNCYDQTEFARDWFIKNNYEIKTFHIRNNNDSKESHSFLVYKDKDNKTGWNWFETTWKSADGIHRFNSLEELIEFNKEKFIKELLIQKNHNLKEISIFEFTSPKKHSTAEEYISNIKKGKKLSLKREEVI